MSQQEHKAAGPPHVRVFWLTIADTRTEATDTAGQYAHKALRDAGHQLVGQRIVRDEPAEVAAVVRGVCSDGTADIVITSGGTGISARDNTYEAIAGLLEKRMDGFGELFRALSYQDIGSSAMLSRAVAGLHQGVFLFAIPGSKGAVKLALEKLILPELGHLVGERHKHCESK